MYKIDKADEKLVAGFGWYLSKRRNTDYVRAAVPGSSNKKIYMHHLIIGKPPAGYMTDHRDKDGTNNQRSNLRHVTRAVNRANSHLNTNNTTGYRGVDKRGERFRAQIVTGGRKFHLGMFDTPGDAHQAYLDAHKRIYGGVYAGN